MWRRRSSGEGRRCDVPPERVGAAVERDHLSGPPPDRGHGHIERPREAVNAAVGAEPPLRPRTGPGPPRRLLVRLSQEVERRQKQDAIDASRHTAAYLTLHWLAHELAAREPPHLLDAGRPACCTERQQGAVITGARKGDRTNTYETSGWRRSLSNRSVVPHLGCPSM